jgi:hypothetical protein
MAADDELGGQGRMIHSKAVRILAGFVGFVVLLFLLGPLLARYDAYRTTHGDPPVFCWSRWVWFYPYRTMADGGTTIHEGFGYRFIWKHRINLRIEDESAETWIDTGVLVRFYLPGYDRFDFETTRISAPRRNAL